VILSLSAGQLTFKLDLFLEINPLASCSADRGVLARSSGTLPNKLQHKILPRRYRCHEKAVMIAHLDKPTTIQPVTGDSNN
jgi:hypothetical protein